ncbi:hypothetical protein DMN91_005316 [Ooceraea biroi]|uniref:NF-kappa-B inhibitor cactus n=1 Tax=Ooceraea biroi TaxID=2015173 RepID=A0A026WY11_OOCBI|nr:NF-kappa-B inhibitor cactus [Ooceraea biroi]EZA60965.1 NF-kappa-B inhibitor cactus [Ooceraea biroi]RLU23038.1 hypothetical protein DMN91_005316 [Ooceraea biroi]
MWRSTKDITQMEKHVTEDSKWKRSHDDNESAGNVDSGFLSGGNLQYSGEILIEGRQEEQPSSSEAASTETSKEPMRTIDSGVDIDLSESLGRLNLKHVCLNPLSGEGNRIQAEPTDVELVPVTTAKKNDGSARGTQQEPSSDERTNNEENWQLYYTQNDDGDTQLHIAIIQGFEKIALSLISVAPHSCLLNVMNDEWQSPLHLAVLTQQPRIVRRLILAGADPSLRNFRGNTALHLACANGDLACTKALTDPLTSMERNELTSGQEVPVIPQDLEQRNYTGQMCLHIAAANGHIDVVKLLIRRGADLRAREGLQGYTALHIAVQGQYRALFKVLLLECERASCLDVPTYCGRTAYQLAQEYKGQFSKEACRKLVQCGATPEPLPESDSDSSEEEETSSSAASYLPAIDNMRNVVGVKV